MEDTEDYQFIHPDKIKFETTPDIRFAMVAPGRGDKYRARFLFKVDVLNNLGKARMCDVALGKGYERHTMAIVLSEKGAFKLTEMGKNKGGGVFRLLVPHISHFPDYLMPDQAIKWEIKNIRGSTKALILQLPEPCWSEVHRQKKIGSYGKAQ